MAKSVPDSLPTLLTTLADSLTSALEATTKASETERPTGAISLLDVKNELLLSYLHNLVFLILLKLRNHRAQDSKPEADDDSSLRDAAVLKLVELRLFLQKGVAPLEAKLKYQIDNLLRAVDSSERNAAALEGSKNAKTKSANGHGKDESEEDSELESEEDDEEEGDDDGLDSDLEDNRAVVDRTALDNGSTAAPRLASFGVPSAAGRSKAKSSAPASRGGAATGDAATGGGVYVAPKRRAVLMDASSGALPTTTPSQPAARARRPPKSSVLDEYLASEASAAPVAEPSIGTNLTASGPSLRRGTLRERSARERDEARERREYEETHMVRLPQESKKERRAKRAGGAEGARGKGGRMAFGGEEFTMLGSGLDRINSLVKGGRGGRGGGGARDVLERSRKRGAERMGAGVEIGERYRKKVRGLGK